MTIYFVTDIESDGPDFTENSMLSFGSVACSAKSGILDEFYAVLSPRSDRKPNQETMKWWRTQPDAFAEATREPKPADVVMPAYANWVESFDGVRVFAAAPLSFDGGWIDEYFRSFLQTRLSVGPMKMRRVFDGFALDIPSFVSGIFAWEPADGEANLHEAPGWWRGNVQHTHKAIDDAVGYANFLVNVLRINAERQSLPQDYMRNRT